jgi:hypothetical protein
MEDLKEVTERVDKYRDEYTRAVTELRIVIAELNITLKSMPKAPDRPCDQHIQLRKEFDGLVIDKKQSRSMWENAIVSNIVQTLITAITTGAVVTALINWNKIKP